MSGYPKKLLQVQRRSSLGFTLIELLAAVGLIVVLLAGLGFALKGRGGDGAALNNAQKALAGLVGTARAQAALHQTRSRLLIYASQPPAADAAKFLRYLQIVREEPYNSNSWVAACAPVFMPGMVCVVPPAVPRTMVATGVNWTGTIALGPASSLLGPISVNVIGQSYLVNGAQRGVSQVFGGTGGGQAYYLEFSELGAVSGLGTNLKLALATANLSPNALPQFNNPNAVRGLLLRKSGAFTFVGDANSF